MTKFIRTGMGAMLTAALLAGATISPASAQDEGRQFSAKAGEIVNETLTLSESGQHQAAVETLSDLIKTSGLNAYERSTIYQMLGQYNYELDRPVQAQGDFESAIRAGGLLQNERDNLDVVIAQLMIGNGQYHEGAQRLEAYLEAGGEQKPHYIELLLNAWVQADDYSRALPWAETWFEDANPKQQKHYDLLNFLHSNLGIQDRKINPLE